MAVPIPELRGDQSTALDDLGVASSFTNTALGTLSATVIGDGRHRLIEGRPLFDRLEAVKR